MNRRAVLTGSVASMVLAAHGTSAAAPLRSPIDVEQRRALVGRPLGSFACGAAGPPIRDLDVQGAYTDSAFSVIDPEKWRLMMEVTRPLGAYSIKVAQLSDNWLLSRPAQPAMAACALAWMDGWAGAAGLLGKLNTPDAQHQRKWTLAGLALAYLKIRGAPGLESDAMQRVENWFTRLADASTDYYGRWSRQSYSNHIHWWALALAATAVATGDRAMFARGMKICREALDDIQADGTLPLELARRGRALGYHVFALTPLVMLAEIGEVNGQGLYSANDGALHRLADRVQSGLADPAWFATRAGAPQEVKVDAFTYVWAEPYYARFPEAALGRQIVARRPLFYHWLGGSTTYGFGSPALAWPPT